MDVIFDVQGIPIEFNVRALRRIEWQSFNINFFLVGRAELLQDAPQFTLAAGQFDSEAEQALQMELVQEFPNVTVISVRAMIEKASVLLKSLAFAVQGMGYVSACVGLLILVGSIRSSMVHRGKDIALFRALGISKAEQRKMLALEFAVLGAVSSLLGSMMAYVCCYLIFEYVFLMEALLRWEWVVLWIVGLSALSMIIGLWASQSVLKRAPWPQLKS